MYTASMKTETIQTLTSTFEAHAQQTEGGVEYWLARDIQHLLGYTEWRNFTAVIGKAKTACEVSRHVVSDHFVEVNKTIRMPNRPLADFAPTIILKAKDFAAEITIFNARRNEMTSEIAISNEHIINNQAVRNTLIERGIRPELLTAGEDVKKVERRLVSEEKKAIKKPAGTLKKVTSDE